MAEDRLIRELLKKIEKLEKEKAMLKENLCAECKRNIERLEV